jgi:hypothetical protein
LLRKAAPSLESETPLSYAKISNPEKFRRNFQDKSLGNLSDFSRRRQGEKYFMNNEIFFKVG